ncbi:MAG: methylmalonyl-CoA mutase family protein [Bacteroidia bacterium]
MKKLFSEFAPATAQDWKNQIVKDLKGGDFEKLVWHNPNGFNVQPFYTAESRDNDQPLFTEANWDICEQITVKDEASANARALKALEGGASGLSFYIHKKINTGALLKNISLEHIYSQFFISNDALHVLDDLKDAYGKVNAHDGKVKCFVNIDPLSLLAYYGEWHDNEEKDLSVLKKLKHIPVNISLYQESGANQVSELAIGLAHTNEYFNYMNDQNLLSDKILHFTFSVGSDFFGEIAKLRAFRKLVTLLQEQYKTDFKIHFHAQTSQLNKSNLDSYTNMLRTTTEGMSAVMGGCNSLSVLPYNETFEEVNNFSARISRNQQHVFKEESYLNKVADAGAGSYYIESLTDELAERAWEEFKEIEGKGGFITCMKNNFIQERISEQADQLIKNFREEKIVLVGVNKFQNKSEVTGPNSEIKAQKPASMITPIKPICLSEHLVKTNA